MLEQEYDLSFIDKIENNIISIICHDQPDPDCLASAMGIKEFLESKGFDVSIYYGGDLSHTQNRVMINVLNIPIIKLDTEDESAEYIKNKINNSSIILVDTCHFKKDNCQSISNFVSKEKTPLLIIDHHSVCQNVDCEYIHKIYGACSTIIYQILKENNVNINSILATALYLGISTDTDNLRSEGTVQEDKNCFEELKQKIDTDLFLRIFNHPKPLAMLNIRGKTYNSMSIKDNLFVSNVGIINPQQRSLLAEICEEILEIEAIETVVILGIIDDGYNKQKHLTASFRSRDIAIDTKDFLQNVFGKKNSGGRKGCGAARILLDETSCKVIDHLFNEENLEPLEKFIKPIFEVYKNKIEEEKSKI